MHLSSQTILVTGGTSGIGFELTKQLLALGNTVIVTGRDGAKLDKAKRLLPSIYTIQSDVSQPKEIEALFKRVTNDFPKLNILINNAGIMREINMHKETETLDSLTNEIDINLKGPIRMTRQFLNFLKKRPNAAIVNVTSGLAFVPLPTSPVYCATKAGLHSFTQSLRVQLQGTSVKVFELAPPATATELLAHMDENDMKGITIMKVEDMVRKCIQGMQNDVFEIRPGQSNQLRFMSRLAPEFILKQLSRPVQRMLKDVQ